MIPVAYNYRNLLVRWRTTAMTAAAFPWVFVSLYFVFVMMPSDVWVNWDVWKESA